jgi:hypothetical protein
MATGCNIAASTVLIAVPSPLEGEGSSDRAASCDWVRGHLGQKPSCEETPSPICALWNDRLALSLKGRGHSNARSW